MKKLFFTVLFFLMTTQGWSYTQQVILNQPQNQAVVGLTNNATGYLPLVGDINEQAVGNIYDVYVPWAAAGKISNLIVNLGGAPTGSGNGYTIVLYKNGSATALSTQILNAATQGSDLKDSVSISAGDLLCIQVTVSGTPASVTATWSMIFTPTTAGQTVLSSGAGAVQNQNQSDDYTFAGSEGGSGDSLNSEQRKYIVFPSAGTVKNLYVDVQAALGAAPTSTWTVYHNGSSTTITTSINGVAQTTANDTTDSFTVAAGDTMYLLQSTTGGNPPANDFTAASVVFVPNTPGQFIIPMSDENSSLSNATYYESIATRGLNNATESKTQTVCNPFLVQAMYVWTSTAAGAGQSYTFTLRDGGASVGTTVTLNNVLTNNASFNYQVKYGDLIDTKSVGSATAASQGNASISYLGYVPPHGSEFLDFYSGG